MSDSESRKTSRNYYGAKVRDGLNEEELEALSAEALDQIHAKRYDAEMRSDGVENILKLGIAFSGKKVKIKTEV